MKQISRNCSQIPNFKGKIATVWKNEKFTHRKKFRQINYLVVSL